LEEKRANLERQIFKLETKQEEIEHEKDMMRKEMAILRRQIDKIETKQEEIENILQSFD
jgi:hypothetical protein